MKKICAIAQKEWQTFFYSPTAYILLIILLTVFNIFFYLIVDNNQEASLRDLFLVMQFLFIFIIPVLTMRSFAEEKHNGTIEFLMTAPVSHTEIILGKFLGVGLFYTVMILFSGVYYGILEFFADPDIGVVMAGYLGLWLEGLFLIAVGLMVSTWTANQIVAVMVSYLFIFLLYFATTLAEYTAGTAHIVLTQVGTITHSQPFFMGIVNTMDIIYYVSAVIFFLMMARFSIENRLWD